MLNLHLRPKTQSRKTPPGMSQEQCIQIKSETKTHYSYHSQGNLYVGTISITPKNDVVSTGKNYSRSKY